MPDTTNQSRHGMRAPGQTVLSITVPEVLKKEIEKLAQADHRTVAAWVRLRLQDSVRRSGVQRRRAIP